ncbi:MAG TPA: dephospho-CoA kinase [Candidatus Dormibacteraeota bacterium]|nr:dephospho-CoA kinase [Candidatus Dormibacteraeota bacterium]
MTSSRGTSRPLTIGLTGPIGCGKSTVAGWLAARGAVVVDADRLARDVVEPGEPALDAVVAAFGRDVLAPDGALDRAALGRRVFADPIELRRLEAIVHPAVRPRIRAALELAARDGAPIVVLEAIRLVEGGYVDVCDEIWLVTCTPTAQRERLVGRGLPKADVEQRIVSQAGLVDRVRPLATRVLDTSGSEADANARVSEALDAALHAVRREARPPS